MGFCCLRFAVCAETGADRGIAFLHCLLAPPLGQAVTSMHSTAWPRPGPEYGPAAQAPQVSPDATMAEHTSLSPTFRLNTSQWWLRRISGT